MKAAKEHSKDVTRSSDVRADYYIGPRAALIAAKVCRPEWFPVKLETLPGGRTKRTYTVEDHKPEVTLTHKVDRERGEVWVARFEVSEDELERRAAAEREKWAAHYREIQEANRERAEQERAAWPLVRSLRARYPNIDVRGFIVEEGGRKRQSIIYSADSLKALQDAGLATPEMLARQKGRRDWRGKLLSGDEFSLWNVPPSNEWILYVHTYSEVNDAKGLPLTDARRLLKAIAAR